MKDEWTPYAAAQALLEIFPGLGRLITVRMRDSGEDEATLMQTMVLIRIQEHAITTSELAKRRKVSLQSASVLVQGLVERGWLMRMPDPNDRRRSLLEVTPEGLARAQAMQEQVTRMIAELFDDLNAEELEAGTVFLPGLRRVVMGQMISDEVPDK